MLSQIKANTREMIYDHLIMLIVQQRLTDERNIIFDMAFKSLMLIWLQTHHIIIS